jgi:hypothetical protein
MGKSKRAKAKGTGIVFEKAKKAKGDRIRFACERKG